jgi:CPA1 family monovalent cation:H+ antiporter
VTRFWEVVTFVVTSFAFLLLGLKVDASLLVPFAPFIVAAFIAILLARVASVYPIVTLARLIGERIPNSWKGILAAARLRGVISVALALSLPDNFPHREAIVAMTFGVALLSLIVQEELLQAYLKRQRLQ